MIITTAPRAHNSRCLLHLLLLLQLLHLLLPLLQKLTLTRLRLVMLLAIVTAWPYLFPISHVQILEAGRLLLWYALDIH